MLIQRYWLPITAAIALLLTAQAGAEETYGSAPDPAAPLLTLVEARRLALDHQPLLQAQAAAVVAARQSVVSAGQLPDPKLKGGITDLTVTGADIGTLRRETDTQFNIGISQDLPRGNKLRLRSARAEAEAERAERELVTDQLMLERDAGLAWVEVWLPQRGRELALATEREAALQAETVQIGYSNGRNSQAEVRAARVALALIRDEIAKLEQDSAHARSLLSRWLGEAADRPLPERLPDWPEPRPLGELMQGLRSHPHIGIAAKEVDVAQAGVALAKQAFKPDLSVELGYGYRPSFSDYVNLQIGIDLPIFTANRQNRDLAARLSELDRAEQLREDDLRQHAAELRLNYGDWILLKGRLARFDETILPEAQARIDAAQLAWGAGTGSLSAVLDARRALLDVQLRRLELETDRAKHALQLRYLGASAHGEEQ
jgi:outer membrane protein, heavy metal efflux system